LCYSAFDIITTICTVNHQGTILIISFFFHALPNVYTGFVGRGARGLALTATREKQTLFATSSPNYLLVFSPKCPEQIVSRDLRMLEKLLKRYKKMNARKGTNDTTRDGGWFVSEYSILAAGTLHTVYPFRCV
jgi:hypothetical protein